MKPIKILPTDKFKLVTVVDTRHQELALITEKDKVVIIAETNRDGDRERWVRDFCELDRLEGTRRLYEFIMGLGPPLHDGMGCRDASHQEATMILFETGNEQL